MLIVGALLMVFSMWWIYFKRPMVDSVSSSTAFVFGYGHYFVFASVAAVGACLAVLVDVIEHHAKVECDRPAAPRRGAGSTCCVISGLHSARRGTPRRCGAGTDRGRPVRVSRCSRSRPASGCCSAGGDNGGEPPTTSYCRTANRFTASRVSSGSSATATKSSERYMFDQWNSRIGAPRPSSLLAPRPLPQQVRLHQEARTQQRSPRPGRRCRCRGHRPRHQRHRHGHPRVGHDLPGRSGGSPRPAASVRRPRRSRRGTGSPAPRSAGGSGRRSPRTSRTPGSSTRPVTADQPMSTGMQPAAPPMTMFEGVERFMPSV